MTHWAAPSERAQQIHDYWFGTSTNWLQVIQDNRRRWFVDGQTLDTQIRTRFAATLDSARCGEADNRQDSIIGAMALILLLDQFPRHMFRGSAAAFASDGQALKACPVR